MRHRTLIRELTLLLMLLMAFPCAGLAQGPVMGASADAPGKVADLPDTKVPKPVGPVNMSTGTVLPKGKAAAGLKAIFFQKNDLYDGSEKKDGNYNGKFERNQRTYQASFRYGLFDDFDMRIMVPYMEKSVYRRGAKGTKKEDTYKDINSGIGDVVFMGRYALWSQRDGDPLSVALGAGVKMPTGETNKENREPFSKSCKYMGPGFQMGTGSWDPKAELGLTRMFGRHRLDSHFMYTWGNKGDHGMRKGDQFKYDLGWGYALTSLMDVELEFNGVNQNRNKIDNEFSSNTGGHTIYLTPGLHFKFTKNLNAGVGVPIVVYRDLNAEPAEDKYCIAEDYRLVFKLAYKFN